MSTLLFDNFERQHILEFYNKPNYFDKSTIVVRFELKKALRDFNRNLTKSLIIGFAEKIIKVKIEYYKQKIDMDNNQISEATAKELIKAFEKMATNTPFTEEMDKLLQNQIDHIKSVILLKEATMHLKYLEASIFTRWYWKRKHEKAKIAVDKLKELDKIK